ncbi:MAG TPA: chemotaxis protein CheW [Aquabacterium sp.]|nr:chemotaxis protein CheW [Aquabacterium sp.]HQC94996.1 chemotaxis protein CheW [Aquabacterium sp.]
MANTQALRDLQTRLAERLQQVRTETPGVSWLAVDCAGQGLLLPLKQAGEIFQLGPLLPVPRTRPWLAGVVNLRGGVTTVVDLARFLGLRDTTLAPLPGVRGPSRLVAFNTALGINCALLFDKLEGLRHAADLVAEAQAGEPAPDDAPRPAFAPARWRDAAGRWWQEIDLAALAQWPQFLAITD